MTRAGLLPVDKPAGPTSHDVVAMARRALGTRRIGHTGTLDPFATGLLVLCVGAATRLAEYWSGLEKTYVGTLRFGVETDTLDLDGVEIASDEVWKGIDRAAIDRAMRGMMGRSEQLPPRYSAKKVAGARAYERARAGEWVDLTPVEVEVSRFVARRVELPEVDFEVQCSSGTYVRALARDLARSLGSTAHLRALRRTRVGPVSVEDAVPTDELVDPVRVEAAWIDPHDGLPGFERIEIDAEEVVRVGHGQALLRPERQDEGRVALVHAGSLVAVAEAAAGRLQPKKVFQW